MDLDDETLSIAASASYNGVVPKVTYTNFGAEGDRTVEFEPGQIPDNGHGQPESLLQIAMHFGIPLEHACGGSCACTTCHVIVTGGDNSLSEADDDELDRLDTAADLTLHSRLGCQAVVKGDVSVRLPAWNRNYVSEGGGSMNLGDAIPPPKH